MKYLKYLALLLAFAPQLTFAAYTVPLTATTTTGTIFASPAQINGNAPALRASFFTSTSTTATSTFSNAVSITGPNSYLLVATGTPSFGQVTYDNIDSGGSYNGPITITAYNDSASNCAQANIIVAGNGANPVTGHFGLIGQNGQSFNGIGCPAGGPEQADSLHIFEYTGSIINNIGNTNPATASFQWVTQSLGANAGERMRLDAWGRLMLGTTTASVLFTVSTSTAPQIGLFDGVSSDFAWTFRSIANNFFLATSTALATSTTAAFSIDPNGYMYSPVIRATSTPDCLQIDSNGKISSTVAGCPSGGGGGSASGANPTASVGLTAVNGSAVTFLRSDGAPALDQTIAPTMTGVWAFNNAASTTVAKGFYAGTIASQYFMGTSTTQASTFILASSTALTATNLYSGAGTVTVPGVFVSDAGGLYRIGTNSVGLTNGVSGLTFNGTSFFPNTSNARNLGVVSTNIWNNLYVNYASTTETDVTTLCVGSTCFNTFSAGYSASAGTISQVLQPSFMYATSTTWTGTTTISLQEAAIATTINGVRCNTAHGGGGTLNIQFGNGTASTTMLNASSTNNFNAFTSNNAISAGNSLRVDIGTPASSPTQITCTVKTTM